MIKLFNLELQSKLFEKLKQTPPHFWPSTIAKQLGYKGKALPISPCLFDWSRHIDYQYSPEQAFELLYMFSAKFNLQYFGDFVLPLLKEKLWHQIVLLRQLPFDLDAVEYVRLRLGLPELNSQVYIVVNEYGEVLNWQEMKDLSVDFNPQITKLVFTSPHFWVLNFGDHSYHIHRMPCEFLNLVQDSSWRTTVIDCLKDQAEEYKAEPSATRWLNTQPEVATKLNSHQINQLAGYLLSGSTEPFSVLTEKGQWVDGERLSIAELRNIDRFKMHLGEDKPFTHQVNGQWFVAGVGLEEGLQVLSEGHALYRIQYQGAGNMVVTPIWGNEPETLELLQKGRLFKTIEAANVFYRNLIESAGL